MRAERRILALVAGLALVTLVAGCREPRQAMYDQAKYEPYEASSLFDDGGAARPYPQGTVARGGFDPDREYVTGTSGAGAFVAALPERITVDRALLARGEEQYGVFCAPCHGALGYGDGMIVQRGYFPPASYHEARLQAMPVGYFYDVITQGFGRMPAYASQVPVEDRWAIVAYIRALQLSQSADLGALSGDVGEIARQALADGPAPDLLGDDEAGLEAMDEEGGAAPAAPATEAAGETGAEDGDAEDGEQ